MKTRSHWMLKSLVGLAMVGLVGLATAAAQPAGQEDAQAPDGRQGNRQRMRQGQGPGRGQRLRRMHRRVAGWIHENLDLTDEQKAQAREIRKAAMEKARAAETPEARREIVEKMHDDLRGLLTDEQKAKVEEWREENTPNLKLTDEQRKAAQEIRKAAHEKMKAAETPEQRREIMDKMHEDLKATLTEEQAKKLEEWRKEHGRPGPGFGAGPEGRGSLGRLALTEEQKAKAKAIREEALKKAKAAETPEARREILTKMHEEIKALLTPEQAEKLEQMRPDRGGRRGEGGFGERRRRVPGGGQGRGGRRGPASEDPDAE